MAKNNRDETYRVGEHRFMRIKGKFIQFSDGFERVTLTKEEFKEAVYILDKHEELVKRR